MLTYKVSQTELRKKLELLVKYKHDLTPVDVIQALTDSLEVIDHAEGYYKVIGVSNFGDEMVSDILQEAWLTESTAKQQAASLNEIRDGLSKYYYQVVPQAHQLYKSEF